MRDGLAAVLGRHFGGPVVVRDLERLSGGASRETWAFTVETGDGAMVPLVLQRERAGAVGSGLDMGVQAVLMRAAAAAGVPVPDVVAASGDGDDAAEASDEIAELGPSWIVSARVEGETIARRILRDGTYAAARARLVADCGRALAAVHRIPPAAVAGLDTPDRVAQHRDLLDQLGQPHPAFELGLRWLDANRPAPGAGTTVVHGDFRLGNFVVGRDGLRAVLDWELAHLGDPVEDLGWLCVRAWRFGEPAPVAGLGSREELLAAYAGAGGGDVDPAALRWWEVMGTLTWGVICIMQTTAHRAGLSRSVELAAIGRRVCETEHDLLALLP
jgi:aminoglycoside phosphotransferase (APT) family kinase protein